MSEELYCAELQARLEQAEATLAALRRGEIDILTGETEPLLVRYKSAIDELARLRIEAERLAQEWQTTFDATNDAIWILDQEHRILRSNKVGEQIFQRRREELIGRHCWESVHGTTQPIPECPILRARHSLRRESVELQIDEGWFEVTTDPILDAAGRYAGAVHIVSDITERKQAEKKIKEQLGELQRWYNVMLDREDRTLELKREVNELLRRLGEPIRYPSAEGEEPKGLRGL